MWCVIVWTVRTKYLRWNLILVQSQRDTYDEFLALSTILVHCCCWWPYWKIKSKFHTISHRPLTLHQHRAERTISFHLFVNNFFFVFFPKKKKKFGWCIISARWKCIIVKINWFPVEEKKMWSKRIRHKMITDNGDFSCLVNTQ